MLLNPNAFNKDEERLQKADTDPFDRPIPGQSLTGAPDTYPWEKPAQFSNPDDAFEFIVEKVKESSKTQKAYTEIITLGMPLESITNTITFGGFVEGLWSVDTAELLKPAVMAFLMMYSDEQGLPFIPFNNDESPLDTPVDKMDDFEYLATMKENNPEAYIKLTTEINQAADAKLEKTIKEESIKNSFLVESPDLMADLESMPIEEPMPIIEPEATIEPIPTEEEII